MLDGAVASALDRLRGAEPGALAEAEAAEVPLLGDLRV